MGVEPLWLTFDDVQLIHCDQLRRYGGLAGVKDVLALGIRLCFAPAKNHGYVDGNKRTVTAAMIEFLAINGYLLIMPNDEPETPLLGQMVEKLVAGTLTEHHLYERLVHFLEDWPEG